MADAGRQSLDRNQWRMVTVAYILRAVAAAFEPLLMKFRGQRRSFCQKCAARQFEMFAEDGRRLWTGGQKFVETGMRIFSPPVASLVTPPGWSRG
jgi:hypothetical protein